MKWRILSLFACCLVPLPLKADVLILRTGQVINGKIIDRSPAGLKFQRTSGTYTYSTSSIVYDYENRTTGLGSNSSSLPIWGQALDDLGSHPWARDAKQIPSTVIDKGILRSVPYVSFRCGVDYEVNIYGDPEKPAGIEIGFYRSLLKDPQAKENCVDFISSLLNQNAFREAVKKVNRDVDKTEVGQWTVEVTPPGGDDSYGGWWLSVYSEKALELSRASPQELAQVTVPKAQLTKVADQSNGWSRDDLRNARPEPTANAPVGNSNAGSVYVRGYTRKDGTYVQPHTRRR